MNDSVATHENTEVPGENSRAVPFKFRFKKLDAKKLKEHLDSLDPQVKVIAAQCYEAQDEKGESFRRKMEEHSLEVPEFYSQLPDLAQQAILKLISDFVKREYLNDYQPVGRHDWAYIEEQAAKSGTRGASFDFDDDALETVQKLIADFVGQSLQNKVVGDKFGQAVKQKFTKAAISRNIGEFSEKILVKLEGWLEKFAEWTAENMADHEDIDDIATVVQFLQHRLEKHRSTSDDVNPADIL